MNETIEIATNLILEFLASKTPQEFSEDEIVEAVMPMFSQRPRGNWHVYNPLRALVASGRVNGNIVEGECCNVSYKAMVTSHDANNLVKVTAELKAVMDKYETMKTTAKAAMDKFKAERDDLAEKLKEASKPLVIKVQLMKGEREQASVEGIFHENFPKMLALAQARQNLFLYGPTGSGKTFVCEQLAASLGLDFAFVSCTTGMSESILGGQLLPFGAKGQFEYIESEFIRCFEKGGLFLLDEADASDANVLLMLNSALSNNRISIPKRRNEVYAKRHPDFICVAAANTLGTGGDRLYAGRNKLDAAFMERFQIGKVFVDYDRRVEEALCPDIEIRHRYQTVRKAINEHRLERAVSTRFLKSCYIMAQSEAKWTYVEMDQALFMGWREEERNKVSNELMAKHLPAVAC